MTLPSSGSCFYGIPVEGGVGKGEVLSIGAEQLGKEHLFLEASHVLVDVAVHEAVHHR